MRFKIPKSWSDVTIDQFQRINKLDRSDELDYLVSLISVLCNLDVETVEPLTLNQLRDIGNKMSFIGKMPDKFVNDFKLNGNTYTVDCNIAHISAGQYIDLNKYIELGVEDNLHKILTIFCLPTKRKWFKHVPVKYGHGYDLNKLSEELLQTPISVAYPLSLFFCKLLEKSMPGIQDYLLKEVKNLNKMMIKEISKQQKRTKKDGVGLL